MSEELIWELSEALESFSGEETFKEIFWSILSFDKQRLSLSPRNLRPEIANIIEAMELFASHDDMGVVQVETVSSLSHIEMEQLCKGLETKFPTLLVLLHQSDTDAWILIYPDRSNKHHLRFLSISGAAHELNTTAKALASLSAVDWDSEVANPRLSVMKRMDVYFPGAKPKQRWEFDPNLVGIKYQNYSRVKKAGPLRELYEAADKYPLLTIQQERGEDLCEYPDFGDEMNEYRQRLVFHNLRLVIDIALKFPINVLDISDIVQEGMLGLIKAAEKYDPSRGYRFSTYAWYWIRQKIFRAIDDNYNLIRWPSHRARELVPENSKDDVTHLHPGERAVELVTRSDLDVIAEQETQIDILEKKELCETVQLTLKCLHEREYRIICNRNGLNGMKEVTLEIIGEQEGVTRERVRQIQMRATEKLKRQFPNWIREEFETDSENGEQETDDCESTASSTLD